MDCMLPSKDIIMSANKNVNQLDQPTDGEHADSSKGGTQRRRIIRYFAAAVSAVTAIIYFLI